MTLCKAWVQATDGNWYADPCWYGEQWFVLMDEKDSEVVIMESCGQSAQQILHDLGFPKCRVTMKGHGTRLFPKDWKKGHTQRLKDCNYREAFWYDFAVIQPGMNVPVPHKHRGIAKSLDEITQ